MTSAARKRLHRARQRQGLGVLRVEVDLVGLAAVLIAVRYLSPAAEDDPEALARAVERMLGDMQATTII